MRSLEQEKSGRQEDFYAWLLDQAKTLRLRQPELVDWAAVAEELEEMALRTRHELLRHLEELFAHLLKLQYEPSASERRRRERQWKLHLTEHRHRINDLLDESRALRNLFEEFKSKAYPRACKLAGIDLGRRYRGTFPADPPWTNAQIPDDNFFPTPVRSNGHSE